MNKKTIAVLLMAAATVLTACGTDKKEPTKENFQAALKTFAEGKETRECVGSLKFPIEQNGNDSVTTFCSGQAFPDSKLGCRSRTAGGNPSFHWCGLDSL